MIDAKPNITCLKQELPDIFTRMLDQVVEWFIDFLQGGIKQAVKDDAVIDDLHFPHPLTKRNGSLPRSWT